MIKAAQFDSIEKTRERSQLSGSMPEPTGSVHKTAAKQHRLLRIIFATTSGHTEFVIDTLTTSLVDLSEWEIETTLAEQASPEDMLTGVVLLLASGTWNTGGTEGQLNPHMAALLDRAKGLDLAGKACACIGLGDHRYFYTARAVDLLQDYIATHHGRLVLPALRIVDEPYDQEGAIAMWGTQLGKVLKQL